MKRKIALLMAVIIALLNIFTVNVSAKVDLPTISKNKPLITYTYNSSGKVYAYKDANLKNETGGYIACSTDECKIIEISGKAVKVIYPVSNGTKTAWFSRAEFTKRDLANDVADSSFTAKTKATTYKWKGKSNTFGSVAKGDKCYLLRGNEDSDWVQIIYPVSKGYKMGWLKGSDYAKLRGIKVEPTPNPVSTSLCSPVPQGCYFNKKTTDCGGSNWYGYHDINRNVTSSTPVYAIADGTIKCLQKYTTISGKEYLVSYGNLIEFTSSDKEYTAKYAHLSKFNGVTQKISSKNTKQLSASKCSNGVNTYTLATKSVKKGEIIGYIGTTGNSSGVHLHFELRKQGTRIDPTSIFDGLTAKTVKKTVTVKDDNTSYSGTKSLADIAKAEIGYQGTSKNGKGTGDYTKYGKWIGSNGTKWCASFVSWCVNQAGVSTKVVPKTPGCDTMESKSNSYSKWNKNALNSIKKNDVIFFAKTSDLSDSNHVGIVTSVNKSKKTITVVEGNTGQDIVKEITYTVDSNSGKIVKGYDGYSFCGYISVN